MTRTRTVLVTLDGYGNDMRYQSMTTDSIINVDHLWKCDQIDGVVC